MPYRHPLPRGLLICGLLAAALLAPTAMAAETVLDLATRPGQSIRVLLDKPDNPIASVVLIAGGAGRLDIGPDGHIGALAGNQLVRTRADYAKAGFITAVPDIAGDLKQGPGGVASGYRWSAEHAADIGVLIAHLRGLQAPVYLVGTSRAALSVSNAAVRLEGVQRPDAIVITSGMLMDQGLRQPSAEQSVGHLERITMPVLLVVNANDECRVTPPDGAAAFRKLLTATPKVDLVTLHGGSAGRPGQQCEGGSYHGFLGLDAEVVQTVTAWLKALPQ